MSVPAEAGATQSGEIAAVMRLRGFLFVLLALLGGSTYVAWSIARHAGVSPASWKWVTLFASLSLGMVLLLAALGVSWGRHGLGLARILEVMQGNARRFKIPGVILGLLLLGVFPVMVMGGYGRHLMAASPRLVLFGVLALAGGTLLRGVGAVQGWIDAVSIYALVQGVLHRIVQFLPDVSTYPLTLSWSEASRYYFASLYSARRVYGVSAPWPVLHPSRYLLQSIPFALGELPLWVHRFWQVFLWVAIPALGAALLARRLRVGSRMQRGIAAAWAFLFFFQAPVYYHLMVSVVLVLWGFDSRRLGKSLVVVLGASVWAGISRVNWVPVPGLLAAAIYLLEREAPPGKRALVRYLSPPVAWALLGSLTALGSGLAYAALSGNELTRFGSSFTSDLLWYRLLPNATYGPGLLRGLLGLTVPPLVVGLVTYRQWGRRVHPLRLLGLAAIVLILMGEGIVVSTKIGGGGDLHNLDAYVILLLVVTGYGIFGHAASEDTMSVKRAPGTAILILAVLLVPAFWQAPQGEPPIRREAAPTQQAIEVIRQEVGKVVARGGEVLFLSQRHLLTFHLVGQVPLIPEYEKTFLMEMAMSNNREYLRAFYRDLRQGRFAIIVSDQLSTQRYGRGHRFGDEDTVWVDRVATPLLQYYRPTVRLDDVGMWLMEPIPPGEPVSPGQ